MMYTDKHAGAGIREKMPDIECWKNSFPGYTVRISIPEFTSVCPRTGLPDHGVITVEYQPKRMCLELKSLKMYIVAYRNIGIFNENAVNKILRDCVKAARPAWMKVQGVFSPRGGMVTTVEAVYGDI